MPAFWAVVDVGIILAGRPAIIPVVGCRVRKDSRGGKDLNRARRDVDRFRSVVIGSGNAGGDAGDCQQGGRPGPAVIVVMPAMMNLGRGVMTAMSVAVVPAVGQCWRGNTQREAECDAD